MLFYCVEPGDERVGHNKCDWHFSIKSGFAHQIAFPHVDSCLGVIGDLGGGRLFAGHINGYFNGAMTAQSHRDAFDAMVAQFDGAAVSRAVFIGDWPNWRVHLNPATRLPCPNVVHMDSSDAVNYPTGVDVLVDVDSGLVKSMPYQADRNFRAAVPRTVINVRTVALGVNRLPCN